MENFGLKIIVFIGGLLGVLLLTAFVVSCVIATRSKYWITQYDNTVYTDEYKEEDGCVYFKDNWTNNDGKLCGDYSIKEWD